MDVGQYYSIIYVYVLYNMYNRCMYEAIEECVLTRARKGIFNDE